MCSIYRAAYLVVAATMLKDSQGRFLTTRQPGPISFDYENSKGEEFTLKARMVETHHPLTRSADQDSTHAPAQVRGPLMSRAWVLQERVLASRLLHFTGTELVFECKSGFACECRPTLKCLPTAPALLAHRGPNMESDFDYSNIWKSLVTTYTKCRLTLPNDKLPAISGLARALSDVDPTVIQTKDRPEEYLAGLWRPYLLDHLLWSTAPFLRHPHASKPAPVDRAPSFSWASVDSEIYFAYSNASSTSKSKKKKIRKNSGFEEQERFVAKVLSAEVVRNSECILNRFCEVDTGHVKLRGPCLKGHLFAPNRSNYEFYYTFKANSGGISCQVEPDTLLVGEELEDRTCVRRALPDEDVSTYRAFKAPVICIAIAYSDDFDMVEGLVLSRARKGHAGEGEYIRIGHFTSGLWPSDVMETGDVTIV
jgi:hypothetical protein